MHHLLPKKQSDAHQGAHPQYRKNPDEGHHQAMETGRGLLITGSRRRITGNHAVGVAAQVEVSVEIAEADPEIDAGGPEV